MEVENKALEEEDLSLQYGNFPWLLEKNISNTQELCHQLLEIIWENVRRSGCVVSRFFVSKDSPWSPGSVRVKHHDSWLPKNQKKTMETTSSHTYGIFIKEHVFFKLLVYWTNPRVATPPTPPPQGLPHQATQLLVPEKCASEGKCLKRFGRQRTRPFSSGGRLGLGGKSDVLIQPRCEMEG